MYGFKGLICLMVVVEDFERQVKATSSFQFSLLENSREQYISRKNKTTSFNRLYSGRVGVNSVARGRNWGRRSQRSLETKEWPVLLYQNEKSDAVETKSSQTSVKT